MNKDYSFRTTIKACAALVLLVPGIEQASAQEICISNGQDRQLDTSGFYWQLWSQDAEPTSCMTPGDGLTFSTRYQNMTNHLARRGLYFGDGHGIQNQGILPYGSRSVTHELEKPKGVLLYNPPHKRVTSPLSKPFESSNARTSLMPARPDSELPSISFQKIPAVAPPLNTQG